MLSQATIERPRRRLEASELERLLQRHALYKSGRSGGERATLADVDLTGINLAGRQLAEADLSGALLTDVNLAGADLSNASLCHCDLMRANLRGASLARADLR